MNESPQRDRVGRRAWGLFVAFVVVLPFLPGFRTGRTFYLQDLSSIFRPAHLWWQRVVAGGEWPLWDPFVGYGQSALANPILHLFFPPIVALRALLPPAPGFDLAVMLPYPVAAIGAYGLLSKRHSAPASVLGALVFTLSGPLLSFAKMLNVSWAAAFVPWVLLATDRLAARHAVGRFGWLAFLWSMVFLAGEPVTFAGALAMAILYAVLAPPSLDTPLARRVKTGGLVVAAAVTGLLLAAPVTMAGLDAYRRSFRAAGIDPRFAGVADLPPMALLESALPRLFGDFVGSGQSLPWFGVGVSGFVHSFYVGVGCLVLGAAGLVSGHRRRWAIFWAGVVVVSAAFALGAHTPVYPAVKTVVPLLRTLRWPIKFTVFAVLALGLLAATGFDALARVGRVRERARMSGTVVASLFLLPAMLATFWAVVHPGLFVDAIAYCLSHATAMDDPVGAAVLLEHSLASVGPRLIGLSVLVAALVWVGAGAGRRAHIARICLLALVVGDLAVANGRLNPTMPTSLLQPPRWSMSLSGSSDRLYVGGRAAVNVAGPPDIDALPEGVSGLDPGGSPLAADAARSVATLAAPSAWGIRESISVDRTMAWSHTYWQLLMAFRHAPPNARALFLDRTGVRFRLLSSPPLGPHREVAKAGVPGVALYEALGAAPRVGVVPRAQVVSDLKTQLVRLFLPGFDPTREVLLDVPPPAPAGVVGAGTGPAARIVADGMNYVDVDARVPSSGGYVVLADTYDPGWQVRVDGERAPLLRANGLFRAVRVNSGRHHVRFRYRPRTLTWGLVLSALTALSLMLGSVFERRRAWGEKG